MNKIILTILSLLFILLTSCTPDESASYAIVSGQIPTELAAEDRQFYWKEDWETLQIDTAGIFIDTIEITEAQYVYFSLGELETRIYLSPGEQSSIVADSTLSFGGSGVVVNNYLYELYQANNDEQAYEYKNHKKIFQLDETSYVQFRDSLRDVKLNRLAKLPPGNEAFVEYHQKEIELDHHYEVARYPLYHSYYFSDYEPTDVILDYYKDVPLDNEADAQTYSAYVWLVDLILDRQVEQYPDTMLSLLETRLAVLESLGSPTITDTRLEGALNSFTPNDKDMEGMRDRMLAMATSEDTKTAISEHYEVIRKLTPGSPSPGFDYENYAGGKTTLAELKGKYVYIDLWATWCGPCMLEIPHLRAIEKEFHDANIEFVSISIDVLTSRDKWRKMIEDKALVGTQLLADNAWESKFVRAYGVRGIPHFILLDEAGNIISADVERPSNPALRKRLNQLVIQSK